jgi:hypothetical protein
MAEEYPCNLPGVLVSSNGYQDQDLVDNNALDSGAPVFRLRSDNGWVLFDVAWSFNALEMQVFRIWHRSILAHGSKSFTIDLWIDGSDGDSQTTEHECYFRGAPDYKQRGRRWSVSATLLAIEQFGDLDECDTISLFAAFNGFEDLNSGAIGLDSAIVLLENLWVP